MQMNYIGCASDVPPGRRRDSSPAICDLPSAILSRRNPMKAEAQCRRGASCIKENQTRSLMKRSFLSKTHLPESNKTKDNDNKINQDKTSF
jgi:hypothetical protein